VDELTTTADATAEWSYTFELDGKVIWSRSGAGELKELELLPETELYELTTDRKPVIVTMTVVNIRGDTLSTALQLPFKLDMKTQRIKRLSLATFAIRSSSPSVRDEELLKFFMARLGKNDSVNVVGYTDDLGDLEGNLRLAQRRAEVVADLARRMRADIKINTVVGVGSGEFPVGINNYDTPENRFLSRVVEVSIVE
jgi:outer membrane protein OmpA-like peptidoglycan-associated protein